MNRFLVAATWVALSSACGPADPPEPTRFRVVLEDLPAALFAVAGAHADDVWVVGANWDGEGPAALHYDGTAWQRHATGLQEGDLHWVHTVDGVAYFGGTGGRILRRDGDEFVPMQTPGTADVWGIWGAAPDDLWAVGGAPSGGQGFVWRSTGADWEAAELPSEATGASAWYKVWGAAADDVWFCGTDGALMRWDGATFTFLDSGTTRPLLTIAGNEDGSVVTAVGGQFSATVLETTGGDWVDVTPGPDAPLQAFGVHHRGDRAYAVGMQGVVMRREQDGWVVDDTADPIREALHAVWIDPDGGVWGVGGRISAPPLIDGTLVYHGAAPPPPTVP